MTEQPSSISFSAFVLSLATTAAYHFGDLAEPGATEPGAVNLEAARQMIDTLGMLQAKTRGNLTAEETQLLEQVLYELRVRYVQAGRSTGRIIQP